MRRRPPQALAALSLLLCTASCALWARGRWAGDVLIHSEPGGRYHRLLSVGGRLVWQTAPNCPYPARGWRWHRFGRGATYWAPPKTIAADGREWSATPYAGEQPRIPDAELRIPHAVIAGVTGGPWLAALGLRAARAAASSRRRGRRAAAGLCPACGYDLRATPERCPECGATPT